MTAGHTASLGAVRSSSHMQSSRPRLAIKGSEKRVAVVALKRAMVFLILPVRSQAGTTFARVWRQMPVTTPVSIWMGKKVWFEAVSATECYLVRTNTRQRRWLAGYWSGAMAARRRHSAPAASPSQTCRPAREGAYAPARGATWKQMFCPALGQTRGRYR